MKNFINKNNLINVMTCGVAIVATIFFFVFMTVFVKAYETHYSMNAIVIGVENDKVLIEDDTNNIWEFEGIDYKINDVVAVIFYTNGTDYTREDDEIIKARVLYNYTSIDR